MNRKLLVSLFGLLFIGEQLLAAVDRRHYVISERDTTPAWEVTRIHEGSPALVRRIYLIADSKGPLLRIDLVSDYANRQTLSSFALLRGSRHTARVVLDMPFASTTVERRVEELRKRPELAHVPVPVTVHGTAGRSLRGFDHDWRCGESAERHRAQARELVGGELVATLTRVRELAGLPQFADLNASLGYLFDDATLVHRSMKLMVATARTDCAFDAKFGVACDR
jgi:hypothetical protein